MACSKQTAACSRCIEEDKAIERRARRDLKMEADRLARQAAYKKELEKIQDELDHQRRLLKYDAEEAAQKKTLQQQRDELEGLKETVKRKEEQKTQQVLLERERAGRSLQPSISSDKSSDDKEMTAGTAKWEWEHLKKREGAKSKTLDELMEMIGLEDVKKQFLSIKAKVDTVIRQDSSLKSERFSCSLLGNPGTGKLH